MRRSANSQLPRLAELGIERVLERAKPDEIYNLAAQSFIGVSWERPLYTADVGGIGVME